MADPWLKFYPADWRNDPALKMCSMAARGLWIELICLMHQATPYGHLLVNGKTPTDAQVAVLVGAPPDQIATLLGELESAGIFSRTRNGTIYSRKLTRMAKKVATARNNGLKGGNPNLSKEKEKPPSDNPEVKGRLKPQKLELESESEEEKRKTNVFPKKEPEPGFELVPSEQIQKPKKSVTATRLPRDWELPRDWGEWALSEGWARHTIREEAAKFRDFWIGKAGKDATKLDWQATWRNWMRNSRAPKGNNHEGQKADRRSDPALEQIARLAGLG